MPVLKGILTALLIISELFLIAVVLLQPGKSAGISGSISGGAETFFGKHKAKTFEGKLQKWTKISAAAFMILTIILSLVSK
ncbi:MAG TPA: preprotein translocase subunit SecG [Clostridiales bacterium]|nr:preprotein translocase subunit SecG [Clostridiales bacterium]